MVGTVKKIMNASINRKPVLASTVKVPAMQKKQKRMGSDTIFLKQAFLYFVVRNILSKIMA